MNREEFSQYPRFYQHLIARRFGLKPDKRIRDLKVEAQVKAQSGKTLQLAPDAAPDYYWDETRDLYEEIFNPTPK